MASTLTIPHLPTLADLPGPPDVAISLGPVPPVLRDPVICKVLYQLRDNTWLITAEHLAGARFLVRDGREVVVDRLVPHPQEVMHLFIQGSCMGALLFQRGSVPLHGNALVTDRGAIILAGAIGAGKSTLTVALLRRGHRLLADDLSAVHLADDAVPLVQAGFPRLKLWSDTCNQFGIKTDALPRIHPALEKFHYSVEEAFCAESQPLHAIYLLLPEPREQPVLQLLTGVAKLQELQAQLYKIVFAEAQQNWPWLFGRLTAIARHARVYLVRRPTAGFHVDALADLITADLTA